MARAKKHKHKDVQHVFYAGKEARKHGLPPLPVQEGSPLDRFNSLGGFEILQDGRRLRRFYAREIAKLKAQESKQ